MGAADQEEYYIGICPKPPVASHDLIAILLRKYRAFRLQALLEDNHKALGRSSYDAERRRGEESYRNEFLDPTNFWLAAFLAPAGLDGNIFRNVSKSSSSGHFPDASVSADDETIVKKGYWMGLCSGHGSISRKDWKLAGLQGGITFPDDIESRYHLANLYFLEGHRGIKCGEERESMFVVICFAAYDYFERLAYQRAKRKPAYCRFRGVITPDAIGTKLMTLYKQRCGYHVLGLVPQVTSMILNRGTVDSWPKVEDDPAFYTACTIPSFEKLTRIDEDGVSVLWRESPDGEVWSKFGEIWSKL